MLLFVFQSTIDQLKSTVADVESKQAVEVDKMKALVNEANEEIKQKQLQYEKEKTTLQDKFNQVE